MTSSSPSDSLAARARKLTAGEWRDLIVATFELGRARLRLGRIDARSLLLETRPDAAVGEPRWRDRQIDRVGRAIARTSHRLPWRTDCLVQALAAQRWLRRLGLDSRMTLGTPVSGNGSFEAHAWLTCGDKVVTGGDVRDYAPFQPPRT